VRKAPEAPLCREAHGSEAVCSHTVEGADLIAQVPKIVCGYRRIAECLLVGREQRNQARRLAHGQGVQEHRVQYAENRCVRADAQPERQNSGTGEYGRTAHYTHRIAGVLDQHRQMLTWSSREEPVNGFGPQRHGRDPPGPARLRVLLRENVRHLAPVLALQIEGESSAAAADATTRAGTSWSW
jgi:hypothetical protein